MARSRARCAGVRKHNSETRVREGIEEGQGKGKGFLPEIKCSLTPDCWARLRGYLVGSKGSGSDAFPGSWAD